MSSRSRFFVYAAVLIAGLAAGAGAVIASLAINRATSTDAFCTSCHSMRQVAADPVFRQSAHRANAAGVRATCADCHIPRSNWFAETWTHVTSGVRDMVAEKTHDYADAAKWQARRAALARAVTEAMRAQDSVTCRSCHEAGAIAPKSEAGRAAHARVGKGGATCVDCHRNLVHAPASPLGEPVSK